MKNRLLHRWVSTLLALCLVTPLAAGTAGAQEKFDGGTDVTYDESVYVTLDAYGNREQLSVVKGVDLNGNTEFYDYGDYERVQDMTGRGEADLTPQGVRWDVTGGEGKRLYFEAVPRTDSIALPWSFQVSYKLNGVPAKAESLAGASGMVEIAVHCIPDDSVEDYYRNNMMLQLAALADMEQVLSIEAPGAQIQAMGKYKAVLFAALPGEEITFQLRIGTEDFSFLGMLMLMEPATLGQMAQLKELRQLMDTVEEIPAGLFGGMGGLLGSLQGIGGQLEQAGGGFAQLQDAYQSVQAYAGDIQVESGALLEALSGLSGNVTALVNGVNNASSTLRGLDSGLSGLLKGGLSEELEALDAARLLEQYQADYDTVKTQADTFSREVAAISSLSGTVEGQLRDTGLDSGLDLGALVRQLEAGRDQLEDLLEQVGAGLEELRPLAAGDGQIGPQLENWTSSVRDALDTLEQVGRDMEQLLSTSSDLFASIADAVSDAGSAFREGMSSILDALEGTGTAGSDLEDAAGQLQQAGGMLQEVLSQAMEDFTGSSNLLEIDTDAQKRSFTSAENAAPESVQAVLRTAPIGFSMTQDQEDKPQEAQTPWQRVLLVFERMKEAVSVLFTKE